jgi:hypothetical protein
MNSVACTRNYQICAGSTWTLKRSDCKLVGPALSSPLQPMKELMTRNEIAEHIGGSIGDKLAGNPNLGDWIGALPFKCGDGDATIEVKLTLDIDTWFYIAQGAYRNSKPIGEIISYLLNNGVDLIEWSNDWDMEEEKSEEESEAA